MGSSVGIKSKNEKEWDGAIKDAFKYDNKIIIEEMIVGRELECAILGNENLLLPKLVKLFKCFFYSYDAKIHRLRWCINRNTS